MIATFDTQPPPDIPEVSDWLERVRRDQGLAAAQEAVFRLARRYPDQAELQALALWHRPQWWQPLEFGAIRLERRSPEHFDFVWSVLLDRDFSRRLKHVPQAFTPRDLLHVLTRDHAGLIPERRAVQWIVFRDGQPIGLSMFVNVNFQNRVAEQIMGILPGHDTAFAVGDAYLASLSFAFNTLGLNKVQGMIYRSNIAVAELQERFGFRREGELKQAVWIEEEQRYEDIIQIALLREEFDRNRVTQRYVSRQRRSAFLMERNDWPRKPLASLPG
jgi:RimJ/RimL family protein N-acetyltransferase